MVRESICPQQRELEEWGGGSVSRRHMPPEDGAPPRAASVTVNPFLEASKPKEEPPA